MKSDTRKPILNLNHYDGAFALKYCIYGLRMVIAITPYVARYAAIPPLV